MINARRRMLELSGGVDVPSLVISYSGTMTDELVTVGGVACRLLTLTSSGTLSIAKAVTADICVVSGGANGENGASAAGIGPQPGTGGAGGYMIHGYAQQIQGGAAVVGAAQELSSLAGIVAPAVSGKNGGTGGGGCRAYITSKSGGAGDGLPKYPFGDTSYWPGPHCAGGGGGSYVRYYTDSIRGVGGAGGTNGGNGADVTDTTRVAGGPGGAYGGGAGGSSASGSQATYYGGGGGGGMAQDMNSSYNAAPGGAGYQGVIYVRIPLAQ